MSAPPLKQKLNRFFSDERMARNGIEHIALLRLLKQPLYDLLVNIFELIMLFIDLIKKMNLSYFFFRSSINGWSFVLT